MNFTKSFEFSDHPFIVEKMIAQHFVIMLFVEFAFCYFAAISTWLKHTYVALCSVLLLCYLSNLHFVIMQRLYINMAQTHVCS